MANLAVVRSEQGIEPSTLSELRALAKDAADSDFFGAKTPAQALIIMMAGKDLGLSYTQALRMFYVVKGKPSLSADGMVAVCIAHKDVCEYFRVVEDTDTSSTWEAKRAGNPPMRLTFTMENARTAGIVSDMYRKYPKRMLSARCKAFLARDTFPDLVAGLYDPDEIAQSDSRPRSARAILTVDDQTANEILKKAEHLRMVSESLEQEEKGNAGQITADGEIIEDGEIQGEVDEAQETWEPGPSNAAKSFEVAIASASDLAALKLVGEAIAESQLPASDTLFLSPLYAARMKALKAIR